jgi:hypothetical protein
MNLVFKIIVQELCELNCHNTSLGASLNNTIGDTIGNGAFAATLTNKTQAAINVNASLSDDPILSQTHYLNSTTGAATLEIVIFLTETEEIGPRMRGTTNLRWPDDRISRRTNR